jgi:hypothetical protein
LQFYNAKINLFKCVNLNEPFVPTVPNEPSVHSTSYKNSSLIFFLAQWCEMYRFIAMPPLLEDEHSFQWEALKRWHRAHGAQMNFSHWSGSWNVKKFSRSSILCSMSVWWDMNEIQQHQLHRRIQFFFSLWEWVLGN